ncbi:hypothetical protein [Paenibacillus mesotrionivorans]|uniref:Uncharacterized protein n=1 Tax=Paenibacillus mesotrionivorans TaxID=3160968 RepID=A0ACC7NW44_9BACL
MNKTEKGLDEMQVKRRDHIGNQSFMLLFYLLLLDIGLRGLGVTWLDYPVNVFLIMIVVMSSYLIRLIAAGAYVGTVEKKAKSSRAAWVACGVSLITCVTAIAYSSKLKEETGGDVGGFLLLGISVVVMVAVIFVQRWSERRNNRGDD